MYNNIIFIGGIHGVGKSTVCKDICDKFKINYLSASNVLKWEEINHDIKNKKVTDIPLTQDRLITGLNVIVEKGKKYLLDGHICLFDRLGNVTPVPLKTFSDIAPVLLIVLLGEPSEIQKRLNERDNKGYTVEDLKKMQDAEIKHSEFISNELSIKCIYSQSNDTSNIFLELAELLKQNN